MNRYQLISNYMVPIILLTVFVGCSRTPCYKGYVPVTEEEALAFGQELIDRAAQGDDSWYIQPDESWMSPEVKDANTAVMYFYGLDIPKSRKKPRPVIDVPKKDEKSNAEKSETDIFLEGYPRRFKNPVLKGVKPMYNTYSIYFDFTFDKTADTPAQEQILSKIETTQERYLTVVKNKKTGEIVIAGDGMKLPKPKAK
ncbi:MAG: hypothetical protein IKE64_01355 [Thermoguttaceae bacterium]|nr:hypothetical protein [Thermoguttaceae bacterium]